MKKNTHHERKIISTEVKKHEFRVTIFGSARIKKNDRVYKQVYEFAKEIGRYGFDIVTGGGPGLMEAANAGHEAGDKEERVDSIGLIIKLPWESKKNTHLEIKKKFNRFSNRLDHFMALSKAVVIMPGGVGTCLEFLYTWQLLQVHHIKPIPIIMIGKMWGELMKWVKKYPLKKGLIRPDELQYIHIAKNNEEALKIILEKNKEFEYHKEMYEENIKKAEEEKPLK